MCRIILALGKFDPQQIIAGMKLMAEDKNFIHELNQRKGQGTWQHPDGWGITTIENDAWTTKRSTLPCYQDPELNQSWQDQSNFLLMHARKASVGKVSPENTHPFQKEEFIFCHNGWVRDEFEDLPGFQPVGETDSERIFHEILFNSKEKPIPQAIKEVFQKYQHCKGTNIILANQEKTFVAIRENTLPEYYGMKLGLQPDALIVSSEKVPTLKNIKWQNLHQGDILEIDNKTLHFQIH